MDTILQIDIPVKPTIAIVEDDVDLRENLMDLFDAHGYFTWGVGSAEDFFRQLAVKQADVVLLDLGLPGEQGLSVLAHLQQAQRCLFMIISASNKATDKHQAFQNGASAYFVKPLQLHVLVNHIDHLWQQHCQLKNTAKLGWQLDGVEQTLMSPEGLAVALTTNEYRLLAGLMRNPGQPFTKDEVLQFLWQKQSLWRDYHAVEVLLSRLRAKVLKQLNRPLPVQTVQARGLVFTAPVKF